MKQILRRICVALLCAGIAVPPNLAGAVATETQPVQRECLYSAWGTTRGDFQWVFEPTSLAPTAAGDLKLSLKKDSVRVRASVRSLEEAKRYGMEYLTYVLWAVDGQGEFQNLGELMLQSRKGQHTADLPRGPRGFIVSAEPHFAVSAPSELVVLRASPRGKSARRFGSETIACNLLPRGSYALGRAQDDMALSLRRDRRTPREMSQALNAIEIARHYGAASHARQQFDEARAHMLDANDLWIRNKKDAARKQARLAVEAAEAARRIATERVHELTELQDAVAQARQTADDHARSLEEARQLVEAETRQREALEQRLVEERQRRSEAERRFDEGLRRPSAEPAVIPVPAPGSEEVDSVGLEVERLRLENERARMLEEFDEIRSELAAEREELFSDLSSEIQESQDDRGEELTALREELAEVRLEAERAIMAAEVAREHGRFEAERAQLERERTLLASEREAFEARRLASTEVSSPVAASTTTAAAAPTTAAPVAASTEPIATNEPAVTESAEIKPESRNPAAQHDPLLEERLALAAERRQIALERQRIEQQSAEEWQRIEEAQVQLDEIAGLYPELVESDAEPMFDSDDPAPATELEIDAPAADKKGKRRWWKPWAGSKKSTEPEASIEELADPVAPSVQSSEPETRNTRHWWTPWRKKQLREDVGAAPTVTTAATSLDDELSEDGRWFFRTRRSLQRERANRIEQASIEAILAEEARLEAQRERLAADHERARTQIEAQHDEALADIAAERRALAEDRRNSTAGPTTIVASTAREEALRSDMVRQELRELQRLLLEQQQKATAAVPDADISDSVEEATAASKASRAEIDALSKRLSEMEAALRATEKKHALVALQAPESEQDAQNPEQATTAPAPSPVAVEERDRLELLRHRLDGLVSVEDSPEGVLVRLDGLSFATGSADLQMPARESLARLAGVLLGLPGIELVIEGHTDATGNTLVNQALSEQRASSVMRFLEQQGVRKHVIRSRGYGASRPISTNSTIEGRRRNRRVDLIFTGPPRPSSDT